MSNTPVDSTTQEDKAGLAYYLQLFFGYMFGDSRSLAWVVQVNGHSANLIHRVQKIPTMPFTPVQCVVEIFFAGGQVVRQLLRVNLISNLLNKHDKQRNRINPRANETGYNTFSCWFNTSFVLL